MSELRQDPTTKDWVILAPRRSQRPHEPQGVEDTSGCPFCPGNEHLTPQEVERIPDLSDANTWSVRVVPNRFPALEHGPPAAREQLGRFDVRIPGFGIHEVVIESHRHERAMADMTSEEIERIFEVYQRRYHAHRDWPGLEVIVIFKNHGAAAGTSLRHPHSQILGSPVETPLLRRRFDVARSHFAERGTCLYCDIRDAEREALDRVVFESESLVAIQPPAPRWPFETWILPTAHQPSFGAATDAQLCEVARATSRVLRLFREVLRDPAFNYAIHTAPLREETQPFFLWHVQLVPRLTSLAGFELGSGMRINPQLPEEAAAILRDADRRASADEPNSGRVRDRSS